MTSHPLDPKTDPKDEKPFVAAPLRDSLSRPLRSSSFGRDARWNLNLDSRFTNRKQEKKKRKKKTKSRNLYAHGRPIIYNDHCPYMCRISSATFVSNLTRDRDRGIRKTDDRSQRQIIINDDYSSQLHSRFFKFYFLKQIVTNENAPTRSETVTICPALPTYN